MIKQGDNIDLLNELDNNFFIFVRKQREGYGSTSQKDEISGY